MIKVELPDVNREDVEVTVENNTLTLRGEKKLPADVKDEQFRRVERRYGTFTRSFTLPTTVDAAKVSADYKNGVLTVKLPFKRGGEAADDQRRSRRVIPRGSGIRWTGGSELTGPIHPDPDPRSPVLVSPYG